MLINQSALLASVIFMTSLFSTIYLKFTSKLNVLEFKENVVYTLVNAISATAFMLHGTAIMNFIRIYHFEKHIPSIFVCYYAVVAIILCIQYLMYCYFTIEAVVVMRSKFKNEFGLKTEMFISKKSWYNSIIEEEISSLKRLKKGA